MADILRSKSTGRIWTSPQQYYDSTVKLDPSLAKHSPEELWNAAKADTSKHEQISNTQMFDQNKTAYALDTLKNAPGSLGREVGHAAVGLISLPATIIGSTALGIKNLFDDPASITRAPGVIKRGAGNLFDSYFGENGKYGNKENILGTIRTDPGGVASDVSTVASLAGGATKLAARGSAALGANAVSKGLSATGKGLSRVGDMTNPLVQATHIPERIIRAVPAIERKYQRGAENAYLSGIGNSKQVDDPEKLRTGARMMIDNKAKLNKEGLNKNKQLIDQKNKDRAAITSELDNANVTGNIQPVYDKGLDVRDKTASRLSMKDKDTALEEIDSNLASLNKDPVTTQGAPVSAGTMHNKLKGINESLESHYAKMRKGDNTPTDNAVTHLKVAAGEGLRESIRTLGNKHRPGLGDEFAKLGLDESHLIAMKNEMNRIVNKTLTGPLKDPPSETAAKVNVATGNWNPWAAASAAKSILKNPETLSGIALRLANRGVPESKVRAALNLFAASQNNPSPQANTSAPPTEKRWEDLLN